MFAKVHISNETYKYLQDVLPVFGFINVQEQELLGSRAHQL